ncbi:regulator of G-protein signaling 9-like isoform X3 [Syngnathoides biaculeatus]|uniref:regulator of G-protein signaling 9-like isoform X3 n=1 Tax=Syngnathoides biaculeatus TaxID=300417 RepID=UPI002ADE5868|nr:regulator of G-protein signaling 9-like isoform X3 [Syngnathoides biaculeatus]
MTIRNTLRDHGQRYRPRMACLKKAEKVLLEMQDPKSGVKSQPQRLVITTIPHAITGEDIVAWLADRFQIDTREARSLGSMLVALGFVYPLQDHKRLLLKPDASLYRFQTPYFWPAQQWPVEDTDYAIYLAKRNIRKKGILEVHEQEQYNHLHKWMNHKWDFIVMQAKEQYRAAKERKKPDRVVFDCQERAYWVVHRPPPGTVSAMDYGLDRRIDPNADEAKTPDYYERIMIFTQQSIMRPRVKSSVSIGALVKYSATYNSHDPFLSKCLPSNPWHTDDVTYWTLNLPKRKLGVLGRLRGFEMGHGSDHAGEGRADLQDVPGPRRPSLDQHRRENDGDHGERPEASAQIRDGRRPDPHLHAHEERLVRPLHEIAGFQGHVEKGHRPRGAQVHRGPVGAERQEPAAQPQSHRPPAAGAGGARQDGRQRARRHHAGHEQTQQTEVMAPSLSVRLFYRRIFV